MWVTPDNLYVLAVQNVNVDCNSVKLGGLTDTLLGYSFLKISLILCETTEIHHAKRKMDVQVTPDTLLFELLWAKNNTKIASKTFKPIVQYYYVVLCDFESEHKWIVAAVPTTWQKLKVFDANFVDKANTFLWHIYKKKIHLHGSICQ